MRRITIAFLALPLILLGLTGLAAAQNVSIQLTPITYPIVLPDSGGSFDYLLTVTNQGGTPITATVWCMATLPNGSAHGPVAGPATRTLAAGQGQSYRRIQTVPPRAPFGYFTLHAYVGIYPDSIWAQDQFEFQHQAVSGTEQEWVAMYNGPGNDEDCANSLAVDGNCNVYVTGYSSDSSTYTDYKTIKYDASGNQIWMARYDGPESSYDEASSLALDGSSNIYVTGTSGSGTSLDYTTVKYDVSGNQLWVARYNGPGNGEDWANALVVDESGNVYVTGFSYGAGYDYATVKYDPSGNQLWVARYSGPGNNSDIANFIALDGGGNVYVTGRRGSTTEYDYATVKYDGFGNQIWVALYNGPGNSYDEASSLALDDSGNVYVTGGSEGSGTYEDYATVKYGASGNQIWAARYNGPGNAWDEANSIALDGSGNVYVTGMSSGNGPGPDYATIKYDASGNQLWVARYSGPGDNWDFAYCLALDGSGNVYVTGGSEGSGLASDYATVKYDAFGNQIWAARYNGPGNFTDVAFSLAIDGSDNVCVTGNSWGGETNYDYCTIKYSGGDIDNWMPVEATVLGQPLPQECRLEQNYPNPFNASTVLSYRLPAASSVSLKVYDTAGRLVETLVDGWRSAGTHELTFDAKDLPSGMYFAKMQAREHVGVQKLVLVK